MYKYTENNLLENPENYFYSKFKGKSFLRSFLLKRKEKLSKIKKKIPENYNSQISKDKILSILIENFEFKKSNSSINTIDFLFKKLYKKKSIDIDIILNRIIQKFEVSKKISDLYKIEDLKPIGNNKNIKVYILFGICLINLYEISKKLKYLNSILKLSDILCSLTEESSLTVNYGSAYIIEKEIYYIDDILSKNNIIL